jgi:hypothetical protein
MEAVSPEPQKPVRRSRKKPATKTDKPAQTVSTSDDTPQSIGANADVTEKPKRRRAPRKKEMPAEQVTKPVIQVSDASKPEEKQPIHQPNKKDTEAASEKTADEKPKQKRGRPRKKPVQVEPPVE